MDIDNFNLMILRNMGYLCYYLYYLSHLLVNSGNY